MIFGKVDKNAMLNPDVSLEAKGLYAILTTYAGKDRECFPGIDTLVNASGKSRSTVFRLMTELQNAGYITRQKRHGNSTLYKVK